MTPSKDLFLPNLLGVYKRTARMANQLPLQQRLIDPKFAHAQHDATGTMGQMAESAG
jgi:hypothetical protein